MFTGNNLIGPFFYEDSLNADRYLQLLQERVLPSIRELIPEHEFQNLWYQQDGCPAHNARAVTILLSETFGDNVISNNGPVPWPARSPDLTPLDFYLWGHMKNEIYKLDPPENELVLRQRVINELAAMNRNTLRKVVSSVLKRCQKCLEQDGRHIEQFR